MSTRSIKIMFLNSRERQECKADTLTATNERLSKQCVICDISKPYRPPRLVTGTALLYFTFYSSLLGLGNFFSFLSSIQSVELSGLGISPLKGHYLHTGQHTETDRANRINACIEWDSSSRPQCSREPRQFML
jgi:hypothetical protein